MVEYTCFVDGMSLATTKSSLEKAFSEYGVIVDSKIIKDREKGIGFVTFNEEKGLRAAILGMNGHRLDGRTINVYDSQFWSSSGEYGGGVGGYGYGGRDGGYVGGGGYGGHLGGYVGGGGYGGHRRLDGGGGYGQREGGGGYQGGGDAYSSLGSGEIQE